jgi:hypothetical protein
MVRFLTTAVVDDGEGVATGEAFGVVVADGSDVGIGELEEVGDGVGVGVATFTPLLQTNFLPDLMQVY